MEHRYIEIPAGVDAGTRIPVTTIRSAQPGPTLALIAGTHGYEYPPILALQRLPALVDAAHMHGTLVLVHVANMPSFLGRTIYYSPVDGKNLNRVYPGRADGTVSERIAYAVTREIIEPADFVLDLHCGDGNESLRPYLYQTITGNADLDARIARLASAFGLDHIILDRKRPTDPDSSLYCSTTAVTRGKPAMTIECGFLGSTDLESVERILRGIRGVMREIGMAENGPPPVEHPIYLDPIADLTSPETGILYPLVERGHMVAKGAPVARVTDFFGAELAVIEAPIAGIVLYIVATPPINRGQPIGCIGAPIQ